MIGIEKILLRRKNAVLCNFNPVDGDMLDPLPYIATGAKNIERFGYRLHPDIIKELRKTTHFNVIKFFQELEEELKKLVREDKITEPMFPGFPDQVMEMNAAKLYLYQQLHYHFRDIDMRDIIDNIEQYEKPEEKPEEPEKYKVLIKLDPDDIFSVFTNLLKSKTSLSEQDKQDILTYLDELEDHAVEYIPDDIKFKETKAFMIGELFKRGITQHNLMYYLSPTDVLRTAAYLSDQDTSLATPPRFKNFSRKERRFLIYLLDKTNGYQDWLYEDMYRHKEEWKRLIEKIHPFEKRYSEYTEARQLVERFYHDKVERRATILGEAIKYKDLNTIINTASAGELTRLLDFIFRTIHERTENLEEAQMHLVEVSVPLGQIMKIREKLLKNLPEIFKQVSTPVLFQALGHFSERDRSTHRVFLPKGQAQKAYIKPNNLPDIPVWLTSEITDAIYNELLDRFGGLPSMQGDIYVSPKLCHYKIPFSQRSASAMNKVITRGSGFEITGKKYIRLFVHWKNIEGKNSWYDKVDIDLSVAFFDVDYNYIDRVAFTNLRSRSMDAVHSGDITNAPNGATEYVDINLQRLEEQNIAYVIPEILTYSHQNFNEIPECFAGWMYINNPSGGKAFKPHLVENVFDITSESRQAVPFIMDMGNNQIIWTDFVVKHKPKLSLDWGDGNIIERAIPSLVQMAIVATELNIKRVDLATLFILHATSRGHRIKELPEDFKDYKEKEKGLFVKDDKKLWVFDVDKGITPFDIDIILGKYLV